MVVAFLYHSLIGGFIQIQSGVVFCDVSGVVIFITTLVKLFLFIVYIGLMKNVPVLFELFFFNLVL